MRQPQHMGRAGVALVALTAATALPAAPAALAAGHGHGARRHARPHTTRSLRITATDSAATPFDHDHPRFRLSLRHGQTVAAGLVRVRLVNRSAMMEHQAQLARLRRGVSVKRFVATARTRGDDAAIALTEPAGGPNTVAPGARQTTWQRLRAGHYVVICLVDTPDGASHLDLGMLARFRVTGRPSGRTRPPGHVQGTITEWTRGARMGFTLPRGFTGHGLYRVRNAARADLHELALLRLAPGKAVDDVIAWFSHPGPPPFAGAGGLAVVPPGGSGWMRLHLRPGHYVATCFVPDDEPPHMPHGAMGMDAAFTIG